MWERVDIHARQFEDGTDDLEAIKDALRWVLGEDEDSLAAYFD